MRDVEQDAPTGTDVSAETPTSEMRGPVFDVVRTLLADSIHGSAYSWIETAGASKTNEDHGRIVL